MNRNFNNNIKRHLISFSKVCFLKLSVFLLGFLTLINVARAEIIGPLHAIALDGSTKYEKGFAHFEMI